MDPYVTGAMIKRLREEKKITQQRLAEKINVSAKAVSKWETGRGYPDISLIEPLAASLGVSVIELFAGSDVVNTNRSSDMRRIKVSVCPLCGNAIFAAGESVVSCCGIVLPATEAEPADEDHPIRVERDGDEYFVSVLHDMTKTHYISFIAAVRDDGFTVTKLYPEGSAEARFPISRTRFLLFYCNRHGLFKINLRKERT